MGGTWGAVRAVSGCREGVLGCRWVLYSRARGLHSCAGGSVPALLQQLPEHWEHWDGDTGDFETREGVLRTTERTGDTGSTFFTPSPLRPPFPRLSFPPLAARGGAGGSLSAPPAMPGVPLPFVVVLLLLAGALAGGFPRDLVARSTVELTGERGSGGGRGLGGGRGVTVSLPVRSHRRVPALRGSPGGQWHGPARPRLPADAAAQRDAARGCPVSAAGLAGARSCVPGHGSSVSVSVLERPDLFLCKDLHTRTAWSLLAPPPCSFPCPVRDPAVPRACDLSPCPLARPRAPLHTHRLPPGTTSTLSTWGRTRGRCTRSG